MDILDPDFVETVRARAEELYGDSSFFCSEAVLRSFLELTGRDLSLVSLASGFGSGMGHAGCACGAVVGGIMALGLFFGRTEAGDQGVDDCLDMARQLHNSFRTKHKAICCRILNKDVEHGSDEQRAMCRIRTGDAAERAAKILVKEMKKRQKNRPEILL